MMITLDDMKRAERHLWKRAARDDETGCLVWQGQVSDSGYGRISIAVPGIGPRAVRAHRMAWSLTHNALLPPEAELDHLCRNRRCIEPTHLDPVDRQENITRARRHDWRDGRPARSSARGSIEERTSPGGVVRYRAAWRAVDATGRHVKHSRTFPSRAEAQAFLDGHLGTTVVPSGDHCSTPRHPR